MIAQSAINRPIWSHCSQPFTAQVTCEQQEPIKKSFTTLGECRKTQLFKRNVDAPATPEIACIYVCNVATANRRSHGQKLRREKRQKNHLLRRRRRTKGFAKVSHGGQAASGKIVDPGDQFCRPEFKSYLSTEQVIVAIICLSQSKNRPFPTSFSLFQSLYKQKYGTNCR